ncbi:MAG: lysophospholipase [Proteobacteria bacterium]|nr:lysophospholipase [Pseudomonadota bacterium]MBU4472443.1 lysophospholipase [Pseudomonadota bacterium]MCG2751270.1 lysophospholipase [Desulfobacteraceae bacterium]
MIIKIVMSLIISVGVYLGVAVLLITVGKPTQVVPNENNLKFSELMMDYKELPELQKYHARDGEELMFRYYPSASDKVLILLHGSGYHSRYFMTLANFISTRGLAHVYTPDLRGHGPSPRHRGDVDYIGQFEDDIADLLAILRQKHPHAKMIVGGHSSGGGLAIRFAGSCYGNEADAYVLLSPFLKYKAPTTRPQSGGWAQPNIKRIIGLSMLNAVGVRRLNHLPVIHFNMPETVRDGTETLSYTYRLNAAFAPKDYEKDLRSIQKPLLVVAGTVDEAFYADRFGPLISQYTHAQVELLEGVTHMGVVVGPEVQPVIKNWLEKLGV